MYDSHRFDTHCARVKPQLRAQQTAKTQAVRAARLRHALRHAKAHSHTDLAQRLQFNWRAIATLVYHTDLYVSNLRRCIADLGGTLEIVVHFPDGSVTITSFGDIDTA